MHRRQHEMIRYHIQNGAAGIHGNNVLLVATPMYILEDHLALVAMLLKHLAAYVQKRIVILLLA